MKITELEMESKNKFFDYLIEISKYETDNIALHILSKHPKVISERYIKSFLENFYNLLDVIRACKNENDLEIYIEQGYPPIIIHNSSFAKTEIVYYLLIRMLYTWLEKDLRFTVSDKLRNLLTILKISKISNIDFTSMINEVRNVFKTN